MYWFLGILNIFFLLISPSTSFPHKKQGLFPLSIIHTNDFHARFEPTNSAGGDCSSNDICIGGYARTVYTVKKLLEEHKDSNPIYLNAGDNFQGTLWYNIGRWNVTKEFLNMLPADAMILGNHEFDNGIEGVVPFLETLKTPVLVANMDSEKEPTMTGKYKKSMIIEKSGRKIGVIGVILETTNIISSTRNLTFKNESLAILEEVEKLKKLDADIIIVISHCGYEVDKIIAERAGADIDVIVGGHSHTFLFTGKNFPGPETPGGEYPTIVEHENGNRVLIVQAAAYARFVGNLLVYFDDNGKIVEFVGAPIYMDSNVPEDEDILEAMKPWKERIDLMGSRIIGESRVDLLRQPCGSEECNLGNFVADAFVHAFVKRTPHSDLKWTSAAVGLVNVGTLRTPIFNGNLTYSQLNTMSPFENTLVAFDLPGKIIEEILEYSVANMNPKENITYSRNFLQVSGLEVVYDFTLPVGKRAISIKVRCNECLVPVLEPLDEEKIYRVVAPNYLVDGGDGFSMISKNAQNLQPEMIDIDALIDYVETTQPIITGIDGRIKIERHDMTSSQPSIFTKLSYPFYLTSAVFIFIMQY